MPFPSTNCDTLLAIEKCQYEQRECTQDCICQLRLLLQHLPACLDAAAAAKSGTSALDLLLADLSSALATDYTVVADLFTRRRMKGCKLLMHVRPVTVDK